MKKKYVIPSVVTTHLYVEHLIAISLTDNTSGIDDNPPTYGGTWDDEGPIDAGVKSQNPVVWDDEW